MSGIQLTEAQEKERLTKKRNEFLEGLEALEKRTGMMQVALLRPTPTALIADLTVIPIPEKPSTPKTP